MDPAMLAGAEQLGWRPDAPELQEAGPIIARGGNLVAVLPPAPAWASPLLAALIGRQPVEAGPILVLAAPAMLGEWAVALAALTEPAPRRIDVAREHRGSGAATVGPAPDIVIASPATALDRHTRSALHPERFRAVVFAWPEDWPDDDAVAAILQDVPRDAQRIVLSAHPEGIEGSGGIAERYARRAAIVRFVPGGASPPPPASVRVVATSWAGRPAVVARALDELDRPVVTIWTADLRDHQLIRRTLGSLRDGVQLVNQIAPAGGATICYDPPSDRQLAALAAVGEVTLLVPPGSEEYVRRLAPTRRPVVIDSPALALADHDAALRARISATIQAGGDAAALYALAPLFELHDPQSVAAAVLALWRAGGARVRDPDHAPDTASTAPAPTRRPVTADPAGTARLWIGAGKKDDATVGDFVAVLIKEAGMDRTRIGRIELRDTFALVEVPAAEAEAIAQRLVGLTIRKRKLSARVDRGPGAGRARRP